MAATLTRTELARKYGVHVSTLARWIKEYKIPVQPFKKLLTPIDLQNIVEKLGPYE